MNKLQNFLFVKLKRIVKKNLKTWLKKHYQKENHNKNIFRKQENHFTGVNNKREWIISFCINEEG